MSQLCDLCAQNDVEGVRGLLPTLSTEDLNFCSETCNETALFVASKKGHKDIVKLLIGRKDLDVNKGKSCLKIACENKHLEVAILLINQRPEIDVNKGSITPLYVASRNGLAAVVQLLLSKDGTNVNKGSPLYGACAGGHNEIVSMLLNKNTVNVNQQIGGESPLWVTCEKRNKKIAQLLLKHDSIVVDDKTKEKHQDFVTEVKLEMAPQRIIIPVPKRAPPIRLAPISHVSPPSLSSSSSSSPSLPPRPLSSSSLLGSSSLSSPREDGRAGSGLVSEIARLLEEGRTVSPSPPSSSSPAARTGTGTRFRALYDYDGFSSDELTFREGDIIEIVVEDPSGWAEGILSGRRAWAPLNYLERMDVGASSSPSSSSSSPSPSSAPGGGTRYRALFDFSAMNPDELDFRDGDILNVFSVDDLWAGAELAGRRGLVPLNYLQRMDEVSPSPPPPSSSSGMRYRALFDYVAPSPTDLSFNEGDILNIINNDPSGWAEAELSGRRGLVPINFLERM